ncbi:MAG: B12-binding domain-containing radical SAM protein, partial [Betaproteobacteria bacterium]
PFGGIVDHLIAGPGEGPQHDLLGDHDGKREHTAPDYRELSLQNYLSPGFILPYSASSGCYWNKCSFCPETAEGNPYIRVPVDRAMADLNAVIKKTNPTLVHLLDNAISPALLHTVTENPIDAPWYGFARISKELADPDFCAALKRSGCVMLKLGLESGEQRVLDRMHKGIDLETASCVLKNLEDAGIATYVYLLFGTPAETVTDARRTLEFVVKHKDAITFLNLAIFNMPVGHAEEGECETEQFYEGDLSLYTGFKHPRGWDRKQVRQFLDTEFRKHRAVSAILKNDPPVFTSNHAAFFANL